MERPWDRTSWVLNDTWRCSWGEVVGGELKGDIAEWYPALVISVRWSVPKYHIRNRNIMIENYCPPDFAARAGKIPLKHIQSWLGQTWRQFVLTVSGIFRLRILKSGTQFNYWIPMTCKAKICTFSNFYISSFIYLRDVLTPENDIHFSALTYSVKQEMWVEIASAWHAPSKRVCEVQFLCI